MLLLWYFPRTLKLGGIFVVGTKIRCAGSKILGNQYLRVDYFEPGETLVVAPGRSAHVTRHTLELSIMAKISDIAMSVKTVVVADGIIGISDGAFSQFEKMTNLILPNTLEHIGDFAFSGCASLVSVDLSDLSIKKIGISAFARCFRLKYFEFPKGIIGIEKCAFSGTSLRHICIPESVITIGPEAFSDCHELIDFDASNSSIDEIPERLFISDEKLKNVKFPDSVLEIGLGAFSHCLNLRKFCLPLNLTKIDCNAFLCSGIEYFFSPEKLSFVGSSAFLNCPNLKEVRFDHACEVEESAFSGCFDLEYVKLAQDMVIPRSMFYKCYNLRTVVGHPTAIHEKAFFDCKVLRNINLSGTRFIGDEAFKGCPFLALSNVDFLSMTYIGREAFSECYNLEVNRFPSVLQEIKSGAFRDCASLSCVRINIATVLGNNVFSGCKNLKSVILENRDDEYEVECEVDIEEDDVDFEEDDVPLISSEGYV